MKLSHLVWKSPSPKSGLQYQRKKPHSTVFSGIYLTYHLSDIRIINIMQVSYSFFVKLSRNTIPYLTVHSYEPQAKYYKGMHCTILVQWLVLKKVFYIWAVTCVFQQCGILTSVDSDEPVQPPFELRISKRYLVSSSTLIEYQATSKGSGQTAHMCRLIWVFAGRTYHIVGINMSQLIYICLFREFLTQLQDDFLFSCGKQTWPSQLLFIICFRLNIYSYSKCPKISNTFLFLLLNKMLVMRAGIHKMLVRITNMEDPDQTASEEAVWSGSVLFV